MCPLVSLIIPCHNAAVRLDATLISVSKQTLRDFECIIVNDGSTDTSRSVIAHWCRRDPRFSVIEHRINAHMPAARNSGLRAARGMFITFLNSGDVLKPHSLESRARTCLSTVAMSDRFAGSYADGCIIQDEESGPAPRTVLSPGKSGSVHIGQKSLLNFGQPMVRAELLRQFGGFCETAKQAEDDELWYRLMRAGYWFRCAETVTIHGSERSGDPRRANLSPALLRHANEPLVKNDLSQTSRVIGRYSDYTQKPGASDLGGETYGPVPATGEEPPAADMASTDHAEIPGASLNPHWGKHRDSIVNIAFFPHKDYHVWTISLIAKNLRENNIKFVTIDLSPQWGEAGIRSSASLNNIELISLSEYILCDYTPSLVVVFNDWDHVTRPIVIAANAAGLSTAAIVEGIQDYHDADTGGQRLAYRAVRHVLLPGDFDRRYFSTVTDQTVYSVGVPRIQALRNAPKPASIAPLGNAKPKVLINSNFSYGVLTEHRDIWLRSAVSAVRAAGMIPIISRHPADKGTLFPDLVSSTNFYTLLEECQITVQRFASGILEAIAREKVVLYFNPHGEKADKFTTDPMNVYPIITSQDGLKQELADWKRWQTQVQANGPAFLDLHSGSSETDSIQHVAMILAIIARRPTTAQQGQRFSDHLRTIDERTKALCHAVFHGEPLFPRLDNAVEQLERMTTRRLQEIAASIDVADLIQLRTHSEGLDEHARILVDIAKANGTKPAG